MSPLERDEDLSDMPPLEGDKEEIKEGKGLKWIKVLTPSKLLTRLPILLAQAKAGSSSYKLKKMKSDKYCLICISTIKSLKRFTTI